MMPTVGTRQRKKRTCQCPLNHWFTVVWLFLSATTAAANPTNDAIELSTLIDSPEVVINQHVRENFDFFGLANYYQQIAYYLVDESSVELLSGDDTHTVTLKHRQWLAVVGRFKVLLVSSPGQVIEIIDRQIHFKPTTSPQPLQTAIVYKHQLNSLATTLVEGQSLALDQLRYAHLWAPLAWLSKQVEATLLVIQNNLTHHWGWTILLFSIVIKLILLPVNLRTIRFQREVSKIQTQLAPTLAEIKANYAAEEAHNRLMAAHQNLGVSPFYTLKPIIGSFIQIPILIAIFNALAEMPQLSGQSFLWINDLAYPDAVGSFERAIPLLGVHISLLPILMTLVALLATVFFQNRYAAPSDIRRQKRNLFLVACLFLVLFYPFPAAMVLYWMAANVLHLVQQYWIKI